MASAQAKINKEGKITSFRLYACIGRDENKKQIMKNRTIPAKDFPADKKKQKQLQTWADAEAEKWEQELKSGLAPIQETTFSKFIDEIFIPVHCGSQKSPSTVKFYKDKTERLKKCFGSMKLDKITAIDIQRYLNDLSQQEYIHHVKISDDGTKENVMKRYSPAYVQHHKTVLTVAFDFAERHDLISRNPMRKVSPIKQEHHDPDHFTQDEAKKFLSVLNEKAPMYWRSAMYVFILTGLRRGELAGLKWEDIDFSGNVIHICRNVICNKETGNVPFVKETKTDESTAMLPMLPIMASVLKAWKKEQAKQYGVLLPSTFIFNSRNDPYKPIRPDSITQWLERFEKRNGIRSISPHDLRHTCGTLMLKSGATIKEVQKTLRHADASTTLKFYIGTDIESLRDASDKYASTLAL